MHMSTIIALTAKYRPIAASYARAFLAAVLTLAFAGERDHRALLAAGLAAIAPPLLRWLNPNDPAIGRGSTR
jgi:hypothetical protein